MRFPSLGGAVLIAATLCGPAAAQTTYNVSTVAELNAAVADVNSGDGGDLIVIAPGTYALTQPLGFSRVVTIVGDPVLPIVLDGNGQPFILSFAIGPATIANMTVQNAPTGIGFGVAGGSLEASGITVAGCDVANTLTVDPAGGGNLTLSWGASCTATDDDYAVYEGTIGSWYSHVSRLCSTGGATTATLTPSPGDTYDLVVPLGSSVEGAYGEDSNGAPIPRGGNACAVQVIAACP